MSCAIKRIIQLTEAVQHCPIKILDESSIDTTNQCKFSWSTDTVCWTNWVDYNTYLNITKNIESDFYLRILISCSLGQVIVNNNLTTCYSICIDSTNPFLHDFCGTQNLFQPYNNLDCALLLQSQLADSIICMFGIPVYYFRVQPREDSIDYTFKEFVMHDVVAVKQIKLMIQDGQLPSSNPRLGEFDFDWEIDWEVELSKNQFAKAFGDNECPTANDFLYIPMMKRMWEVNAAYDEKQEGLMWRPTTWKLQLVKYNEATNVISEGFDNIIDNWITNTYEEKFGVNERIEQRRTGGDSVEAPLYAADNLYDIFKEDAMRSKISNSITITDKIICHRNNIVARNEYVFASPNDAVIYQNGICGNTGTLSFIIETPEKLSKTINKSILNFGEIDIKLVGPQLNILDMKIDLEPNNTYMVIYRWDQKRYIIELNIYKQTCNSNMPKYNLRPEMYYFDFENPVFEHTREYFKDYTNSSPQLCQIQGWPLKMCNIKLYNQYLPLKEAILESTKYSTTNQNCTINDLARKLNTGRGYAIR